jgi:hypothetical protein
MEKAQIDKPRRSRLLIWIITIPVALCLVLIAVVFFLEITPTFVKLPIDPPNKKADPIEGWNDTTFSTFQGQSRAYIWRREATNTYGETPDAASWESIIEYFDERMANSGWSRSNSFTPCRVFLPEASFLPENSPNGYVYYRRKNYIQSQDSYGGDFVCLAVWSIGKQSPQPEAFEIVLVTVHPSVLSELIERLP